jgi:hypothetical protein
LNFEEEEEESTIAFLKTLDGINDEILKKIKWYAMLLHVTWEP